MSAIHHCAGSLSDPSQSHPRILEISYAFVADALYKNPGWRDKRFDRRGGHLSPQDATVGDSFLHVQRKDRKSDGMLQFCIADNLVAGAV